MSLLLDQGGAESDIVERLRDQARRLCDPIDYPVELTAEWEAATEIASLREERDALREEVGLWKGRYEAERQDHEASLRAHDRQYGY